jgi:hypothetical protein
LGFRFQRNRSWNSSRECRSPENTHAWHDGGEPGRPFSICDLAIDHQRGARPLIHKLRGPRCIRASRGPFVFDLRRMSGRHQLMFRDPKARGLCAFNLADMFRLSAAQMTASSCCSPQLRRDLAFKQGQAFLPGGVILLTKCEPTDIVSAFAARRHDHMIGRQCLRSQGQLPVALTGAARRMLRQMCGGVKYTSWTEPANSALARRFQKLSLASMFVCAMRNRRPC